MFTFYRLSVRSFLNLLSFNNNLIMVKKKQKKNKLKTSSTALPQVTIGNFEILPTPTKSQSDKKEYKVIRLENGLTACLISDVTAAGLTNNIIKYESESSESESESDGSETATESNDSEDESEGHDKRTVKKGGEEVKLAAASLCVGVGSFSDLKEVPGLAHFVEHMVFMGSKKFPKENDFDAYIKKHGGSDNAATDYEKTTFYFECFEKYLYKSMDKFAQFFISPLMKKESMTRERESVESEFQNSITSDEHRKEQLLVSFADESSPVNNFSWGNMITLNENIDDDKLYNILHEFRQQHYSAHRMTLAVQARLPLEVLERYVVNCFSQVPNNKLPAPDFTSCIDNIFNTPQFKKVYYVKPVKDLHQVELTWMLPPTQHLYRSKPADYVSWLLLHEGPGGLLSYFKNKLWALAISGECDELSSAIYTHFSINITLTPEGLLHLPEVVQAVFGYIKMLKKVAPDERIFKEIQLIEELDFRFQEEEDACSTVEDLSESMHYYPPEDYLTGPNLYFEYNPKEIANIINALVPKNMNMMVLASTIPYTINYDKVEPWFKTNYCELDFDDSWMKMWQDVEDMPEFHLPNPNPFITDDFSLLGNKSPITPYPVKIVDTPLAELWYKGDDKFKLPFAYYYYYLITPISVKSVKSACLLDIFVLILNTNLVEEVYNALIAGLAFKVSAMDKGMCLNVSGYNQKLPALINMIAQYMVRVGPDLQEDLFDVIKKKLGQIYNNKILKPSVVCRDIRLSILQQDYFTLYERNAIVNEITFEDLKEFSSQLFKTAFIKCLVQGNVDKFTAQDTTTQLIDVLNYAPIETEDFPKMMIYEIPTGEHCCRVMSFNKQSPTSMITNYYQFGLLTLKDNAIAELIMLLIEEPLFDILRTKEQLGYNVSHSIRDTYGVLGFSITVQAQINKFKTDYIDSRIEAFLLNQYTTFKSKGKQKFTTAQRGLIKLKQCVDVDLEEEVSRNWGEIIVNKYMFDRLVQEVKIIEALKLNEVQQWWYENSIFNTESNFRKITFQVVGHPQSNIDDEPDVAMASLKTINSFENDINDVELESTKLEMLQSENEIKSKGADYFIQDIDDFRKNLSLIKF